MKELVGQISRAPSAHARNIEAKDGSGDEDGDNDNDQNQGRNWWKPPAHAGNIEAEDGIGDGDPSQPGCAVD